MLPSLLLPGVDADPEVAEIRQGHPHVLVLLQVGRLEQPPANVLAHFRGIAKVFPRLGEVDAFGANLGVGVVTIY